MSAACKKYADAIDGQSPELSAEAAYIRKEMDAGKQINFEVSSRIFAYAMTGAASVREIYDGAPRNPKQMGWFENVVRIVVVHIELGREEALLRSDERRKKALAKKLTPRADDVNRETAAGRQDEFESYDDEMTLKLQLLAEDGYFRISGHDEDHSQEDRYQAIRRHVAKTLRLAEFADAALDVVPV